MNVSSILEGLQQGHVPGSRSLSFALDRESTMTVGNIIKGKVMRHYEGSRYAVDFGDRERVVDSSIPLRTGELIRGRVLAVDEKVHVQRIYSTGADNEPTSAALNRHLEGVNLPGDRIILRLFEQYQARLSNTEFQQLSTLVAKSAQPELMALSALVVSKMGSRMEPEFIRAIYRHLQNGQAKTIDEVIENAPALAAANSANASTTHATEQPVVALLAGVLAQLHQRYSAESQADNEQEPASLPRDTESIDTADRGSGHSGLDQSNRELSERLFNVQNDNSVAHRLVYLPLWLGDKLVEIQVAFFAQKHNGSTPSSSVGKYRKIVFSLETEYLGHVEVSVLLANRHVRIEFITDNSEATSLLARFSAEIETSLHEMNWEADELSYSTASELEDGVLSAVVEHYITQDSFSRLM